MIQTNTTMLFYVHLEVIDIARCCHDINLDNPEEKMDITAIDLKNDTIFSSHIHDVNVVHTFYGPFLSSTK